MLTHRQTLSGALTVGELPGAGQHPHLCDLCCRHGAGNGGGLVDEAREVCESAASRRGAPPQWWPAPTFEPAIGLAAPDARPLIAMSPTMIQRVLRMPIWWLTQPSTGGPQRKAT
ncbi:hypothetical protein OR221_0208 [Microbacterium laevaniformans OR221]|nr:hypothetical protein OR221_0208 [Microbacterium laevaniformans OR221]